MPQRKQHQLKGTIEYCWPGTSKSKIYKNQLFYCLEIESQSLFSKRKETIYAFFNLLPPEVWKVLEERTFAGQKYLFFCEKRTRGWRLKKWTEIKE